MAAHDLFHGTRRSVLDEDAELPNGLARILDAVDGAVTTWEQGGCSREALAARLAELTATDSAGCVWTVGATTRSWYRKDPDAASWTVVDQPDTDLVLVSEPDFDSWRPEPYDRNMDPGPGTAGPGPLSTVLTVEDDNGFDQFLLGPVAAPAPRAAAQPEPDETEAALPEPGLLTNPLPTATAPATDDEPGDLGGDGPASGPVGTIPAGPIMRLGDRPGLTTEPQPRADTGITGPAAEPDVDPKVADLFRSLLGNP